MQPLPSAIFRYLTQRGEATEKYRERRVIMKRLLVTLFLLAYMVNDRKGDLWQNLKRKAFPAKTVTGTPG